MSGVRDLRVCSRDLSESLHVTKELASKTALKIHYRLSLMYLGIWEATGVDLNTSLVAESSRAEVKQKVFLPRLYWELEKYLEKHSMEPWRLSFCGDVHVL